MPSPLEFVDAKRREEKARYDLPKEMSAAIGRIITRWAYAETNVQTLIYEMTYVSDAVGRVAIREPRLTDRLTMVADLMAVEGAEFPPDMSAEFKNLVRRTDQLSFFRDLCAHGTWSYSKEFKSWCVTNTRGVWEPDAAKHGLRGKKRIKPEGRLMDPTVLNEVATEIEELIEGLKTLPIMVGIVLHTLKRKQLGLSDP